MRSEFQRVIIPKRAKLGKETTCLTAVDVKHPLRSDCKVRQSALFREGSRCPCRCETCVTLGLRLVPWCDGLRVSRRHCRHAPGISARLYKLLKVPAYPNISDLAAVDPRRCTEFCPGSNGNLTEIWKHMERIQRM